MKLLADKTLTFSSSCLHKFSCKPLKNSVSRCLFIRQNAMISKTSDSVTVSIKGSTYPCIKHFNPKKKLVVIGVSALLTCCGALRTSFFLGFKMFIYFMHNLDLKLVRHYSPWIQTVEIP